MTLYGAKRANHGTYQVCQTRVFCCRLSFTPFPKVTIDNVQYPTQNGSVSNPELFQTSLFQLSNLTQGQHTLILESTGAAGQYLDLDFVSDSLSFGTW